MKILIALCVALGILLTFTSCSNPNGNILAPGMKPATNKAVAKPDKSETHLWGLYNIYIDTPSKTATVLQDRSAMFTANVVEFLNLSLSNIQVLVMATPSGPGYVDADVDITLKHPFPGLTQYNGYDVRGVFMGNGNGTMVYNSKLKYPVLGTDQFMLDDPVNGDGGGPDGYTRWFNQTEFGTAGPLGYTKGLLASPGYSPSATLCPYKYFADNLGVEVNVWDWLTTNTASHGVFTAGHSNTRNYYLRFPTPNPNLVFTYAVLADWKGETPADHPANAPEALSAKFNIYPDIYFANPASAGGNLIADVSVFDWGSVLTSGVMQDYTLLVESNVLNAVHTATESEMTPIASGDHWFQYHMTIPTTNVAGVNGNEFWLIVQYNGQNYKNNFLVTNLAGDDPLAAFYRQSLAVSSIAPSANISATNLDSFDPTVVTVNVGEKIRWTNNDVDNHSVKADSLNVTPGGPDSDGLYPNGLASGDSFSWIAPNVSPGTKFFYHCRFHGFEGNGTSPGTGMVGTIVVGNAPTLVDVSITSLFTFDPMNVNAVAGATVRWTNNSPNMHSVTFDPLDIFAGGPDSDTVFPSGLMQNDQYNWVVPNVPPGTKFYYHCRFHGTPGNGTSFGTGMVGSVTVL